MDPLDIKKRILAAHKLIGEETTTKEKFESIKTLLKNINPKIDKLLHETTESLSKIEKLQKGQVIELTVEHLPENTEEKKKRKKAILLFIQNWKSLHSEVHRVRNEIEKDNQSTVQKIQSTGKIISAVKGPFGIITIIAVISVIGLSVISGKKQVTDKPENSQLTLPKNKIQVIIVDGKQIPLTELITGQGAECKNGNVESLHYHAKNHLTVKALDGSIISDPSGCGLGQVNEVEIVEIEN